MSEIGERANAAAARFLASLNTPATNREAEIITNAYAAGFIHGTDAEKRCKRRAVRRYRSCHYNARG